MFKKLLFRFTEPSTWAGLAVLGGIVGIKPEYFTSLHGVVTAVAAAAAVFLPESAKP